MVTEKEGIGLERNESAEDFMEGFDLYEEEDLEIDGETDAREESGAKASGQDESAAVELPEALLKRLEEERRKAEQAIADAIANGDTNSEIYKGLQRHLNARNREIEELRNANAVLLQRVAELMETYAGVKENVEFVTDGLLQSLPEYERDRMKQELERRRERSELNRMKEQLASLRQPAPSVPPTGAPVAPGIPPGVPDVLRAQWEEALRRREQFIESRKQYAKRMGVDPNDSRLNYGDPDDGVLEITQKFEESLFKILEEKDEREIDGVREKRKAPTSRAGEASVSGDGLPVSPFDWERLLTAGANQRLNRLRRPK